MVAYTPGGFSPQSKKKKKHKQSGVLVRLRELAGRLFVQKKKNSPGIRVQQAVLASQQRSNSMYYPKLFGGLAVAGLCVMGGLWCINGLLMQSDIFRVTELKVHGSRATSPEQVLAAAELEQGVNLFAVEKKEVARRITGLAWVKQAKVTKLWPSGLEIAISEHRPIALANMEQGDESILYYIDNTGKLFARVEKGQDVDFPVITGLTPAAVEKDGAFTGEPQKEIIQAALQLLKYAARGNAILPIQSISEIHIDEDEGLIVYLVEHPFPIYFGTENVYTKYYRLVKILERLYRKEQIEGIEAIRMDYMENKILVARADFDR